MSRMRGRKTVENKLARQYRRSIVAGTPDIEARNRLLVLNLPLIRSAARKLHVTNQRHTAIAELVNVGCIGFLRGLERFDPSMGYRISTFCLYWVKNAIHEHVRESRWTRYMPEAEYRLVMKMHTAMAKLPTGFSAFTDLTALASALNIHEADCHRLFAISQAFLSTETPQSRNGKLKLIDTLVAGAGQRSDGFVSAYEEAARLLAEAMLSLSAEERKALKSWYFDRPYADYMSFEHDVFVDTSSKRRKAILAKLRKVPAVHQARRVLLDFQDR
jgi:RNA polymerase sigma factor (sigma-70 family)